MQPHGVLPFALDRDLARKRWQNWLGKLWFAPSDLRRMAVTTGAVAPVYVPFWTFDSRTDTHYTGAGALPGSSLLAVVKTAERQHGPPGTAPAALFGSFLMMF